MAGPSQRCESSASLHVDTCTVAQHTDTFLVCNHTLLDFPTDNADMLIIRYTNCGNCNVISGVDSRWQLGGARHYSTSAHRGQHLTLSTGGQHLSDSISHHSISDINTKDFIKSHMLQSPCRLGHHAGSVLASGSLSYVTRYSPLVNYSPVGANWTVIRNLHTTKSLCEEAKSKVEETVKALKKEKEKLTESSATAKSKVEETVKTLKKEKLKTEQSAAASVESTPVIPPAAKLVAPSVEEEPSEPVTTVTVPTKKSIGQKIMDELKHYYHGFRLLFIDIRVAGQILWKVLKGKNLTRRQRRQVCAVIYVCNLKPGKEWIHLRLDMPPLIENVNLWI